MDKEVKQGDGKRVRSLQMLTMIHPIIRSAVILGPLQESRETGE
ncbi:hypothetical protein [Bacillus sp. V3B]|nr:hypothetical protein [Bacillus sp. V3B]